MNVRSKIALARSVLRYQIDRKPVPVAVAWLVTGRCTADCAYCRWKDLRKSDELDTSAALRLIDQMHDSGVRLVSFTGGEPLLRDDIGLLIAHVKRGGMVCKLNTNGALVPRWIKELRKLDLLQISLDGPPDVQDRLRGAGSARRAALAVKVAREAGIEVQLITCLTRDNVRRLDDVLNHAAGLGVRMHIQPIAPGPWSGDLDSAVPAREELVSALQHLLYLVDSRSSRARCLGTSRAELLYYLEVHKGALRGCHCALVTATLLPDGRLIFCGNGRDPVMHDVCELGFAEAFSRLTIPDCDGCSCVGKLRISRVFRLDPRTWIDQLLR